MTEREIVEAILEEFADFNGVSNPQGKTFTYEALKAVFSL